MAVNVKKSLFGKNALKISSVLLVVVMLVLSVFTGVVPVKVKADTTDLGNLLKIKSNVTTFFGQNVILKAGEKYSYSYYYSSGSLTNGKLLDGNDAEGANGATVTVTNTIYDDEYNKVTYEFIAPENATSAGEGMVRIYLGIAVNTAGADFYYYGFDVHAVDDATKTNLFNDPYLTSSNSLRVNVSGTNMPGNWYKPYAVTDQGATLNSNRYYNDESLESKGGLDFFKKPSNVLQVKTTKNIFFGQNVVLDAGKTYAFSYYYEEGKFVDGVILDGNDAEGAGGATVTVTNTIYDNEYNKVTYEFVAPTNATSAGDGKVKIYLGIRKNTNGATWNFYGFRVYAVDDAAKTNLFNDARFTDANTLATAEGTTGNWYKPYPMADAKLNSGMFAVASLESVGGMDIFKKPQNILVMNTSANRFFGQNVILEAGKKYSYSFYYENGKFADGVLLDGNDAEGANGATVTVTNTIYDDEYNKVTYEFVAPANATSAGEGKVRLYLGLRKNTSGVDFHFYGFNVHDVADEKKTNLFSDSGFTGANALYPSGSVAGTWHTPYTTKLYNDTKGKLSTVSFDSKGGLEFFKKTDAHRYVIKLEPESENQPYFGQIVSLEAGKTYIYTNYYLANTPANLQACYADTTQLEFDVIDDKEWSKQSIKFTVPVDARDNDPNIEGNKIVWVGFRGNKKSFAQYYYGFKLYDIENPEVNLLKDYALQTNGLGFNVDVWKTPSGNNVNYPSDFYSEVTLESIGGINTFLSFETKCDVNGDGAVDICDLVRMKRYQDKENTDAEIPDGRGDLDNDGYVALDSDLLLLKKELLKK